MTIDRPEIKRCLNCGSELIDGSKYCHVCAQPTDTARLSSKSYTLLFLASLTRINKGLVYTCWNLLIHPWRVVSDYLNGKRVRYTPPVQLLIVLSFITVVMEALGISPDPAEVTDPTFTEAMSNANSGIIGKIFNFYFHSTITQYILLFLPLLPALMIINRRKGTARYNLAEYLVASFYMSAMVLTFNMLCTPLSIIAPGLSIALIYAYSLIMGSIGVWKSLNHLHISRGRKIWKLVLFYILAPIFYLFTFCIPLGIAFYAIMPM